MSQENIPEKVGILDLLRRSSGTQFVIPVYQRNYTWTAKKEVKQLFDDLLAILNGERLKHFIGIIIYLEKSISPFYRERSVIDGQQRLTTIFITMYAIKEYMLENGMEDEAKRLENRFLINSDLDKNRYKLKPLVSDDEVYQHIVSRDFSNIPDKNSNVYKNFLYVKTLLKDLSKSYGINDILNALDKLYIVCVPIGSDDYPQKIFESINATGAKLTASDLIRNFLLMPIESDLQDTYYDRYWKKVELLVDSDAKKLEAFFRFFIIAKRRSMISKSSVYHSFTRWYDNYIQGHEVQDVFIEIVNYANYYNCIYKLNIEDLEYELRLPMREFRLTESDMPAPMLMELYSIYMHKNEAGDRMLSAKQLGEVLAVLNSYLMRRSLCGMDTSDISNYFPELLRNILNFCNGDYSSLVEVFKRFLIDMNRMNAREMPDDKRLFECIRHANMYRLRQWVNIFFKKLESEDNPAPIDFSALSIEHLMPQTPLDAWLRHLQCDKETYMNNVNRLGNLTLASRSDNSRMSNHVWEYKNKILSSTNHLRINTKLLELPKWGINEIEKRTDELINDIIRLYPYYRTKEQTIDQIPVFLEQDNVRASAYYNIKANTLVIEKGSTLRYTIPSGIFSQFIEQTRRNWIEEGIIVQENGMLCFAKKYQIESKKPLSLSEIIILSDSAHDSTTHWQTIDGLNVEEWLLQNSTRVEFKHPVMSTSGGSEYIDSEETGEDILLQTLKINWSFFNSGITLNNESREKIQGNKTLCLRRGEKRNIKIIINNEVCDAILTMYNYDGRNNDVIQIRYPGKDSLIIRKVREICADKYRDLEQKRRHEKIGIEYPERTMDRYVHIYATGNRNIFKFRL